MDKVQKIPPMFWLKAALVIVAFVAAVIVLRKVAQMNKVVLGVITFVVVVLVGFNWVYERNEPEFMTPFINHVAPFFPSKGSYGGKQQSSPKM